MTTGVETVRTNGDVTQVVMTDAETRTGRMIADETRTETTSIAGTEIVTKKEIGMKRIDTKIVTRTSIEKRTEAAKGSDHATVTTESENGTVAAKRTVVVTGTAPSQEKENAPSSENDRGQETGKETGRIATELDMTMKETRETKTEQKKENENVKETKIGPGKGREKETATGMRMIAEKRKASDTRTAARRRAL
mmetsp:Transcript_29489/g.69568  ORF Transcript_29489/g.69568 Transcript_29489/m.69568 type:complete len:195 (+) Transcript_29489:730-1314(+)